MIFILVITALATTAKGYIKCNFTKTSGGQQCFGAVGQLLLFHLSNTPNTEIRLTKDNKYQILRNKNLSVTVDEEYVQLPSNNNAEFLNNGVFTLGKATKRHSGNYTLEEFNYEGALLKKATFHLEVQAAVSGTAVSQMCLSPEQVKVCCSSEGDGLGFRLSLDGELLINTSDHSLVPGTQSLAERTVRQDKSNISHVTICFNGQLSGNLMCEVWNKVNKQETLVHLMDCEDLFSSFPVLTVAVIAGVVALLLFVALCLGIKKRHHKPRPTIINDRNYEDVVYSEVKVKKK